jgi:hypothetical protein
LVKHMDFFVIDLQPAHVKLTSTGPYSGHRNGQLRYGLQTVNPVERKSARQVGPHQVHTEDPS